MQAEAATLTDISHEMEDGEHLPRLWMHKKRKDWGLAILAWEGQEKRRFQFQDGKARTFKAAFYGLLEEVDEPLDVTEEVVAELEGKLDLTRARREVIERAKHDGRHVVTFDDQWRIFEHLYPGGFEDPDYVAENRRDEEGKRRKSHVDPAVEEAQAAFEEERLRGLVAAGEATRVYDDLVAVLSNVSLASGARHVGMLAKLHESRHEAVAKALVGLLYGDGPLADRVDAWVGALSRGDEGPSWELATALPALVQPEEHVCVKASAFRTQARWMAPKLKLEAVPDGATYERVRAMAGHALERLQEKGAKPRDLLDVHAFVWLTLRPKAREILDQLRREG
ncbi:MAG: hypothetical protein EP329_06990 [Deltaproteobacteria bacterium]|nr:MAG: hypothetical protein EP329_06990 [Deltaproteobacteria bacterium]